MRKIGLLSLCSAIGICALANGIRAEDKWVTIKGQIVFDGPFVPKRFPIKLDNDGKAHPDKVTCAKDADFKTEDWVVNPKNKGVRDVFVWLAPDVEKRGVPFPQDKIHPDLVSIKEKVITIDQPCCRFIPRVVAVREGQTLKVKSSPDIAHNANFQSDKNGNINKVIPAGGAALTLVEKMEAEPGPMMVACNIHPWMKSIVRAFDHPYYAITDEDGKFEIKLAPTGKFRLYIWKDANGWKDGAKGRFGEMMEIKGVDGVMDLKQIKLKMNKD